MQRLAAPARLQCTPLSAHAHAHHHPLPTHPPRPEYCTVSSDGTARIWDASCSAGQQLYEFRVTGDGAATALAYHPIRYELAIGFEGGTLRVFDVATTTLLREARQHAGPVVGLLMTPEGARLFSCGADGTVVVCDAVRVSAGQSVGLLYLWGGEGACGRGGFGGWGRRERGRMGLFT